MTTNSEANLTPITRLTVVADICSAYLSNNVVSVEKVPEFIRSISEVTREISETIEGAQPAVAAEPQAAEQPVPAVPVSESVNADYIVCLEDGKKYKSLKRHLKTSYDMTPEQYRSKWGLPATYPMVSKNYSEARSALAKSMGLGQQPVVRKKKA